MSLSELLTDWIWIYKPADNIKCRD